MQNGFTFLDVANRSLSQHCAHQTKSFSTLQISVLHFRIFFSILLHFFMFSMNLQINVTVCFILKLYCVWLFYWLQWQLEQNTYRCTYMHLFSSWLWFIKENQQRICIITGTRPDISYIQFWDLWKMLNISFSKWNT